MHNKKCKGCGKQFYAIQHNTKYCSKACRDAAQKERDAGWPDRKKEPDKLPSVAETNRQARAAGMTYGKYVAMKYIEEQRKNESAMQRL